MIKKAVIAILILTNFLLACPPPCVDAPQLQVATQQIIQNYYQKDNKLSSKYSQLLTHINNSHQKNININELYIKHTKQLKLENLEEYKNLNSINSQNDSLRTL
ncbi:MAG: hypothetical protein M0R46_10050 [Candidatus Muirbacterium halophilum]|nr:hypothetical protein [Candidatus Muirbacterium halophilum]